MKAWLRSKKDDLYAIGTIVGIALLLILAAPYCC